jgi:hypothetical protein
MRGPRRVDSLAARFADPDTREAEIGYVLLRGYFNPARGAALPEAELPIKSGR